MGEDQRVCSNCKKNVSRGNFTVHQVHCQRNITTCSLCHEPVPRSQYQQHVEAMHSSIPCQRCGSEIEAVNLFNHQNEFCPKRLIACKYCELELTAEELLKHVDFCGARTERCKGCTKYVQFKYLQFHYEHDHKYLSPGEKEKAEEEGKEGEEGEECPVCLGPVTLPLTLECGHIFCMVCVKGIANTTKNCAICRRDIQRDMLMDIRFCREEDVIKNYVNNPKYKKTVRSRSVPSRRVGVTTQDYDNMVSALLSSRTSPSNCRYQRPNNGHTPAHYTPYCYFPTSTTNTSTESNTGSSHCTTTSSVAYLDNYMDDCCCSSSKTSNPEKKSPPRETPRQNDFPKDTSCKVEAPPSSISSSTFTSTSTSSTSVTSHFSKRQTSSSKPSCNSTPSEKPKTSSQPSGQPPILSTGNRPRRPTSLALKNKDKERTSLDQTKGQRQPQSLSQEEYDRWLAFQLAQQEDEISAGELNKNNRSPFRRSRSMPERNDEPSDFTPEGSRSRFSQDDRGEVCRNESLQNRLPPASPRGTSGNPTSGGNGSTPAVTSISRGSSLTKSSSDSSANGNTSSVNGSGAINTGARPKSSAGLKKRVSFKEETPPVRRKAPVMLPCEFCDEMFPERDLMRHQTSCDQNETKNPREYLLSRRSSATSPMTSPTSPLPIPLSAGAITSSLNGVLSTRPPPASTSSFGRSSESPSHSSSQIKSCRTPPQSPSPRRHRPSHSPISPPRSPSSSASPHPPSSLSECYFSPFNSRHASVSPGPCTLSNSSSSGVSSGASTNSNSSVSTTPSTSSSASPVPALLQASTPDTPTDTEVDFEDDHAFSRPRKGRLISSAITSWRSISGSKPKDHLKYSRSHTAPLEVTVDEKMITAEISTSHSSCHIRSSDMSVESDRGDEERTQTEEGQAGRQDVSQPIFIRNRNKYPAPPPPPQSSNQEISIPGGTPMNERRQKGSVSSREIQKKSSGSQIKYSVITHKEKNCSGMFKFDSIPIMNGKTSTENLTSAITCEFCQTVLPPEKFRAHQAVCEASREKNPSKTNHSRSELPRQESKDDAKFIIPPRRNKGPAPQPPSEVETHKRKPSERSRSVRETASESRFVPGFESFGHRLERACSIKETSRFSTRTVCDSPPRKWMSREGFYGSSIDCSAAYSAGGSVTSSTTSLNNYPTTNGWSSHVNMIREEVRSRRSSYAYAGSNSPLTPFFGAIRYRERSSSRSRPSSLYASRNAFNIVAEAFAAAKVKSRYLR